MSIQPTDSIIIIINMHLPEDTIAVRRPHFHLDRGSLTFLISRRSYASLSGEEQAIWKEIDGTMSVGQLRERFGKGVEGILQHFVDLGVCEVLPSSFPADRRRVVIVEPHMDDAALSLGGIMWMRRNQCEFVVVTVAGISNFTTYYLLDREYFDVNNVSALRRAESELFLRHLGGRHIALDVLEGPLRYSNSHWTLNWFRQHVRSIVAFYRHCARPDEIDEWTSKVAGLLAELEPQEIWIPLGVGPHVDHHLTREACLRAVRENPRFAERSSVSLYQDVPYAALFPSHTANLIRFLGDAGACIEEQRVDIGEVMPKKLRLLSIFGSQFKMYVMRPRVERCARQAGGGLFEYAELLYKLNVPPTASVEGLSGYESRAAVAALSRALLPWLRRTRSASLIRFLLPNAVGRWAEDMQYLLETFPRAMFEVHVGRVWLAETERFISPRIRVKTVASGWKCWSLDAVRTLASRPNPLIIIAGRDAERRARLLSLLGAGSSSMIAPTMSEFILALRAVANETSIPPCSPSPPAS